MVSADKSDQDQYVVEQLLDGQWHHVSTHPTKLEADDAANGLGEQGQNIRVRFVRQSFEVAEREPADSANKPPDQNLRILIVEDDPINQKVILAFLDLVSCQCDCVENGAEAVAAVMRSPYDIVLMDIQMPVMDGLTATKEIRSLGGSISKIPIIAVTANVDQRDRKEYFAAGMNEYIAKPVDRELLIHAICRCTGRNGLAEKANLSLAG